MLDDLVEFHLDLLNSVRAKADALADHTRSAFVEEMVDRLVTAEEIQGWTPCFYEGRGSRRKALGLDGYSDDALGLDGTVTVILGDLHEDDAPASLNKGDVQKLYDQALAFVEDAVEGRLHEELEPSTPAADFARVLFENREALNIVRVFVVTNAVVVARKEVERKQVGRAQAELHVWDLTRFHRIECEGGREAVDIDLTDFVAAGLPALKAGIGATEYGAYLCVVPGDVLASLYDRYGGRLLEANVRAFLSFKAGVNQGIRKTILNAPERFFAYNNGITATASDVTVVQTGSQYHITRIKDLQIVNGGQTTATLFTARTKDPSSVAGVFVQLKLSVLSAELADEMIPFISQYANTQNAVSDADLSANKPFHKKMEELSRRLWAPAIAGAQHQTHWFYERARAQYITDQSKLSVAKKKVFLAENPKIQLIAKTDAAKYVNSWAGLPHIVSRAAAHNFADFNKRVGEEFDKRPEDFNDRWFQHFIAKAIIFKATGVAVQSAPWFGGYRANTVTYAIARLVKLVDAWYPGRIVDLDRIWRAQKVSEVVRQQLDKVAEAAQQNLLAPPHPYKDVGEWAKKLACWERFCGIDIEQVPGLEAELRSATEERGEAREARKQGKEDDGVAAVVEVSLRAQTGYWKRACDWVAQHGGLVKDQVGLIQVAADRGQRFVPLDFQARKLLEAAKSIELQGFQGVAPARPGRQPSSPTIGAVGLKPELPVPRPPAAVVVPPPATRPTAAARAAPQTLLNMTAPELLVAGKRAVDEGDRPAAAGYQAELCRRGSRVAAQSAAELRAYLDAE